MKNLKLVIPMICLFSAANTCLFAGETEKTASKLKESLSLQSSNEKFKLSFSGRIQVDGALFHGEDYQPLGNGVGFRRVRFGANLSFGEHLSGKIEMDVANGAFGLRDAFIQYDFLKGLNLKVGNFKEAFAMEAMNSSGNLLFLERANVVNAFGPERHLGIQGNYQHGNFLGIGGIHFQSINGSKEKDNVDANNKNGTDEGISYTGRIVWMPRSKNKDKGLHFGLAASYRTPRTDVSANNANVVRYSTSSVSSINKIKFMDTGLITSVNHDWLAGVELAGYYQAFRIQSEYIMNNTYRLKGLPTEKFYGTYAQAAYLLFGGRQVYSTSRGSFSQPKSGKKWGDIEVAARYDYLDLNGVNVHGGKSNIYTLGVNYYMNEYFKIQLNYAYINHDQYANADGSAKIGYKDTGEIATKPEEIDPSRGKPGNDYGTVSIRFQLNF